MKRRVRHRGRSAWMAVALLAAVGMTTTCVTTACTTTSEITITKSDRTVGTYPVPACPSAPCPGPAGTVRWTRPLSLATVISAVSGLSDYRSPQIRPPGQGSLNEDVPLLQGAGTARTYVLSLGDALMAFDVQTGAVTWTLPANRLPARSVITQVTVQGDVVHLNVTQERGAFAGWRWMSVLVNIRSGRILGSVPGYQNGLIMATATRAVIEDHSDGALDGVDLTDGRVVWKRVIGRSSRLLLAGSANLVLLSLPQEGTARSMLLLDPASGRTTATVPLPRDKNTYSVSSWRSVAYFSNLHQVFALDTSTRRILWTLPVPRSYAAVAQVDPADGTAYVTTRPMAYPSRLPTRSVTITVSGRRISTTPLTGCQLWSGTTLDCLGPSTPVARASGGPVAAPSAWHSPTLPFFSGLEVGSFGAAVGGKPYAAGLTCAVTTRAPATSGVAGSGLTCTKPYLVIVNR